jgi:hypothetical protein
MSTPLAIVTCGAKKDDPADVARVGFEAMMGGDGVSGGKNKLHSAIAQRGASRGAGRTASPHGGAGLCRNSEPIG